MGEVVSVGSVNVDLVASVDAADVEALSDRYPWFPAPGETTGVDEVPGEFEEYTYEIHTGGKGANQAVAASRAGAETAFLGRIGEDHGEYGIRSALEGAGVDTGGVEVVPGPTGRAYVFVDETGENYIVSVKGANGRVDVPYVREHYSEILNTECVLIQNELPREPIEWLLSRLDEEEDRPTVILDPAPAPGVGPLLAHESVDVITPNEIEYGAIADRLDAYSGVVIRTRGAEGVAVEGGEDFSVTPPPVEVVDTTGAGDVLNGYLGAGLSRGDPLREAAEVATTAATLSVRVEGARGAPTCSELERFLD